MPFKASAAPAGRGFIESAVRRDTLFPASAPTAELEQFHGYFTFNVTVFVTVAALYVAVAFALAFTVSL